MKVWIANYGRRESFFVTERPRPADVEVEIDAATLERWQQTEQAYWELKEEIYGMAVAAESVSETEPGVTDKG